DAVDQGDQQRVELPPGLPAARERGLRADRAPARSPTDPARVAVVRDRVEMPPCMGPEEPCQLVLVDAPQLLDRVDPATVEPPGGPPADPPERLDRQWPQEPGLLMRLDDEQPVRLGGPARHLGEHLRPGDPDGDREPDSLPRLATEARGDLPRGPGDPLEP